MTTLAPTDEAELAALVADAAAAAGKLELRGGGSKAEIGGPDRRADLVDLRAIAGVVDYDPTELVLTVRPGTPLAEVQALVADQGQALAFDPFDHGPLFGRGSGATTMGGIAAAGVAGSGRLGGLDDGAPVTALRLEGIGPSIAARLAVLDALEGHVCRGEDAPAATADAVWTALRTLSPLRGRTLWRIGAPARAGAALLERFGREGAAGLLDWGGALLWLGYEGDPAALRRAVGEAGGHAMLVRGPAELRARIPALHPQPAAVAALEARVRRAFDPAGVFETGRLDGRAGVTAPLRRETARAH